MSNLSWRHQLVVWSGCAVCLASSAAEWPPFEEVYRLVRSNLVGMGEADLDRAAVEGLLRQLRPRVLIESEGAASPQVGTSRSGLASDRVFDRTLACVRVHHVEPGLAKALRATLAGLADRSQIEGLVLDLRCAEGADYAEAGRVADCFVATARPLLKWGDETVLATAKTNAFSHPVAVLVNGETRGAAEALAAALRHAEVGLLLGSATAGQASLFKEFPLTNGQRLRIASTPVCVGDGREIPPTGIKPDIEVIVRLDEERLFLEDPYRVLTRSGPTPRRVNPNISGGATNRPGRINEADLVRMKREGQSLDDEVSPPARAPVAEAPAVNDPVLARALDLLKGLAVLKPRR